MADIERMRAALVAARKFVIVERTDAELRGLDVWVAHCGALLAQIDAALAQEAQR